MVQSGKGFVCSPGLEALEWILNVPRYAVYHLYIMCYKRMSSITHSIAVINSHNCATSVQSLSTPCETLRMKLCFSQSQYAIIDLPAALTKPFGNSFLV